MFLFKDLLFFIGIAIVSVLIIATVVTLVVIHLFRNNKMHKDVRRYLNNLIAEKHMTSFVLEYKKHQSYDIYFETKTNIYFIKLISNYSNNEICVNSALKWQLRSDALDKSLRLLDNIEPLMMLDVSEYKKKVHKVFLVYPNAHSLLKYINECEMIFIHPNTDVYGTNVITYATLMENKDIFDK